MGRSAICDQALLPPTPVAVPHKHNLLLLMQEKVLKEDMKIRLQQQHRMMLYMCLYVADVNLS